jgi:thioredoxin
MTITILDFTARWCGPCKTLEPVLAELVRDYRGGVAVTRIDVDDDPISAQRYDVRAMPTLVFVRDGKEVGRVVGARPRRFLAGVVDRALAGDVAIAAP